MSLPGFGKTTFVPDDNCTSSLLPTLQILSLHPFLFFPSSCCSSGCPSRRSPCQSGVDPGRRLWISGWSHRQEDFCTLASVLCERKETLPLLIWMKRFQHWQCFTPKGRSLVTSLLTRGQTFHTVLPGNSTLWRAAGGRT